MMIENLFKIADKYNAWNEYYSKYENNDEKSRSDTSLSNCSTVSISETSRSVSVDSFKNTISSPKPLTDKPLLQPSYLSIVTGKKEENKEENKEKNIEENKNENIEENDDMVKMMNEMINIRKEMSINTKNKNDIEEKIKKLKEELEEVEKKVSDNKSQLKILATKFAEF